MLKMKKEDVAIFYVGKKAKKRDTVAGTGLIWRGFGDSHVVGHSYATILMEHPDVWCNEQDFLARHGSSIEMEPVATTPAGLANISEASQPQESADDDGSDAEIINAILILEPGNPDHFNASGSPKIEAVRALVGDESITVKAVNAAWKKIKE